MSRTSLPDDLVYSQVARLQLFANGLHTDDMFFSDRGPASPTYFEVRFYQPRIDLRCSSHVAELIS
jgi:hypothetical protein